MELDKEYKTLINLIILFIIMSLLTLIVKYYFRPFISMIILFMLSKPLYNFLKKIGVSRKISAALSILIINIVLAMVIVYLGSSILLTVDNIYNDNLNKVEELIAYFSNSISKESYKSIISIIDKSFLKNGALSTGEALISYFLGNICAFFILIDREKMFGLLNNLIPKRIVNKFNRHKGNIREMLVIESVLIIICTVLTVFGFAILRIPKPLFLGIICGILDILPYVGTIIVFIPIIIYNIIVKKYLVAFGLLLLYILIQVIREILEAKFLSDKLELHPLLVLLSVYIGVKLFGILGAIVGPMYGILAKEIIYSKSN